MNDNEIQSNSSDPEQRPVDFSAGDALAAQHSGRQQARQDYEEVIAPNESIRRQFGWKIFFVRNRGVVVFASLVVAVLFGLIIVALLTTPLLSILIDPPDADGDGVVDSEDQCEGFDDRVDLNENGIPDGCDEKPPEDFVIDIVSSRVFPERDHVDVVVELENTFPEWGLREFVYEIRLFSSADEQIAVEEGSGYILPLESKYVVALNIATDTEVSAAEFEILEQRFAKTENLGELVFPVTNVSFLTPDESGELSSVVSGTIRNETPYSFDQADVVVRAYDENDRLVGATSTRISEFATESSRDFRVIWDMSAYRSVEYVEVDIDVNIYDSDSFVEMFEQGGGRFLELVPSDGGSGL